jgi:hypothetical protein
LGRCKIKVIDEMNVTKSGASKIGLGLVKSLFQSAKRLTKGVRNQIHQVKPTYRTGYRKYRNTPTAKVPTGKAKFRILPAPAKMNATVKKDSTSIAIQAAAGSGIREKLFVGELFESICLGLI